MPLPSPAVHPAPCTISPCRPAWLPVFCLQLSLKQEVTGREHGGSGYHRKVWHREFAPSQHPGLPAHTALQGEQARWDPAGLLACLLAGLSMASLFGCLHSCLPPPAYRRFQPETPLTAAGPTGSVSRRRRMLLPLPLGLPPTMDGVLITAHYFVKVKLRTGMGNHDINVKVCARVCVCGVRCVFGVCAYPRRQPASHRLGGVSQQHCRAGAGAAGPLAGWPHVRTALPPSRSPPNS